MSKESETVQLYTCTVHVYRGFGVFLITNPHMSMDNILSRSQAHVPIKDRVAKGYLMTSV